MSQTSRLKRYIVALTIIALLVGNGFLWGFWTAAGESPLALLRESTSYTPPDMQSASLAELADALAEDGTSEQEYREGYNCVDYAWGVMRALQWQGIPSGIVALTFEDGSSHAILVVPTEDSGWQFIEPKTDALVSPRAGSYYNGKRVATIEVMVIEWVDIAEFADDPILGGDDG